MKHKLFWIVVAFIMLGCLRLVYDPCYQASADKADNQVLTIKMSELPPMTYREIR